MTTWDDQFEGHAIFGALDQVAQALDASEDGLSDVAQNEAHSRLARVTGFVKDSLGAVDAQLVSQSALDDIANRFGNVSSHLQQFVRSPQQGFLDQANAEADAILGELPAVLSLKTPSQVEGLQQAVSSFRRSVGQYSRNIESRLGELDGRAETISQTLAAQEQKVHDQDSRIDAVVAEFQEQFSNDQAQRQANFGEMLEGIRSEAAASSHESKTKLDEHSPTRQTSRSKPSTRR